MDLNKVISWAKYKKRNAITAKVKNVSEYLLDYKRDFIPYWVYRDKDISPFAQAHKFILANYPKATEVVYHIESNYGRLKSLHRMAIFYK